MNAEDMTPDPKPTVIPLQFLDCPACNATLFGITRVGDACICIACRALITLDVIDGRPLLRHPTDLEELTWLRDPHVLRAIGVVARHHDLHGSPHPGLTKPTEDDWGDDDPFDPGDPDDPDEMWKRHEGDGGQHPPY